MAPELYGLIDRQGNRPRPEIRDVRERLAVGLLADRAMAKKATNWSSGDAEARGATETGAILVHHAFPPRAMMIATASSEAVSVSMRKLRIRPFRLCVKCDPDHSVRLKNVSSQSSANFQGSGF
jgi:hypothetical protein